MDRNWIVGIVGNPPDREDLPSPADLLSDALRQLAERVRGSLVLAAVPTEETAEPLLSVVRDGTIPVHLVAPREHGLDDGEADSPLGELLASAASVSVQPGRGSTSVDWDDCDVWLRSVSDIRILFAEPPDEGEPGSGGLGPTVFLDPADGKPQFRGFPESSPLEDEEFEAILTDLEGDPRTLDTLETCKKTASATAGKNAPRARIYESASLLLNLSPSIIFGVGAAVRMAPRWLEAWSFAAMLAAGIIAFGLSRLGAQRSWLSSRALAEICRSQLATRGILDPLFPPSAIHLPRFASAARSLALMDCGKGKPNEAPPDIARLRDGYVKKRLTDKNGQIQYYRERGEQAEKQERWLKRAFYLTTALAFFANLAAMLFYMGSLPGVSAELNDQWISGFAVMVFPSLAAAAMGFLAIHEASRRSHAYLELAGELERRVPILQALQSESSITEAVREIENLLLEEVSEWFRGRIF